MTNSSKLTCVVPSYYIEGSDFTPILQKAEKGESSWHYPTHIVNLLVNPLPLFIFDEIYIDKIAFERTLDLIASQAGSYEISDLLEAIGALSHVKLFRAARYIGPKVPDILKAMEKDDQNIAFDWAVRIIQDSQGQYAIPNNYRFELINMNITTVLMSALGNAVPYDEAYRALLYEQKILDQMKSVSMYRSFEDRIRQIRKYHIGQPPLRIDGPGDIKTIGKEHRSQRVKALRKKIRESMSNPEQFQDFLECGLPYPQNGLSRLATGWDVFFDTVATFGAWAGIATATGGWVIPAMIVYAATSGKLIKDLAEICERRDYMWYEGLLTVLKYAREHPVELAGVGA